MTNRDVASMLIKLLGLWYCVSVPIAAMGAVQMWSWWWAEPEAQSVRSSLRSLIFDALLPGVVYLGIGVPLWLSGEALATFIFPEERPLGSPLVTAEALMAAGVTVLGVWFVGSGIPALVRTGTLVFMAFRTEPSLLGDTASASAELRKELLDANAMAGFAAAIAYILVGAAMILGSARLARAFARVKREVLGGPIEEP